MDYDDMVYATREEAEEARMIVGDAIQKLLTGPVSGITFVFTRFEAHEGPPRYELGPWGLVTHTLNSVEMRWLRQTLLPLLEADIAKREAEEKTTGG